MASKYLTDFSQRTTIHGVADICHVAGYKKKAFWIIVLSACICAAGAEIYRVFYQFNQKPILTTYEYRSLSNVTFPKVLLCLPHFINSTKVAEDKIAPSIVNQLVGSSLATVRLSLMVKAIDESFQVPTGILAQLMMAENESVALTYAKYLATEFHIDAELLVSKAANELKQLFPSIVLKNDLFAAHFDGIRHYLTSDGFLNRSLFLGHFGLQINETIAMCYFNRMHNCNSVTKAVFDLRYQRCFQLDVNEPQRIGGFGMGLVVNTHGSTLAWSSISSLEHGVEISISNEYVPFSSSFQGIPAGTNAHVLLRPSHHALSKGKKYGTCQDDHRYHVLSPKIPYSDGACRGDCLFTTYINQCGCMLYFPAEYLRNGSDTQICQTIKQQMCQTTVESDEQCISKCKPRCNYWQYNPTVSYTKFPSPKLGELLATKSLDKNVQDIICVVISFAEMTYTLVSEEDSLTFDGFIGQIGGHLGLFLGCSIISVIQLIAYILSLLFKTKSPSNKISETGMKNQQREIEKPHETEFCDPSMVV